MSPPAPAARPTAAGAALLARFSAVRIINLARRDDRRREITGEFARLGLAIDGDRIAFHDAASFADPGGFRTPGARGCFHSHLAVLDQALAAGYPDILIVEDDLDFAPDAERRIPTTLDALADRDWSIFYGGHLQWSGAGARNEPLAKADPRDEFVGAHMIAMRIEGVARAVPYLQAMLTRPPGSPDGGPMDVDGAYGWFRAAHPDLQTWVAAPPLGVQRPSRTDIHPLGWIDRNPLTRSAAALARRVKRAIG